jgi:hypothetical protein
MTAWPVESHWAERTRAEVFRRSRNCLPVAAKSSERAVRRRHLDVAALSDRYGIVHSGQVLAHIDLYYTDQRGPDVEGVATQLARQLADPRPADQRTIGQLGSYKDLDPRWTSWETVTGICRSLAVEMTR